MATTGANNLYVNRLSVPNTVPYIAQPVFAAPSTSASPRNIQEPQTSETFTHPASNSRPNTLEIPFTSNATGTSQAGVIPKLPLQLTKSIEEMLRPTDGSNIDTTWNKPLAKDWADKVSTPAFNREVVAKFFPECANGNIG